MAEITYVAVIEAAETGLAIWFPDFPGCVAGTEETDWIGAKRAAEEALTLHVAGMVEDGEDLPRPTSYHAIGPEDVTSDFLSLTWVKVEAPAQRLSKSTRLNISFESALLKKIDRDVAAQGGNRSGWLAEAAKEKLAHSPFSSSSRSA